MATKKYISIKGNEDNNKLTAFEEVNFIQNYFLDGLAGADTLTGGKGDDYYYVDNLGDIVSEGSNGGGTDNVKSSVTFTLPVNVENLTLTGSGDTNGTGNSANNLIMGNTGKNTLTGDDGNDYLNGSSGADTLYGGNGKDTLNGGDGVDSLIGGADDDNYYVDNTTDSVTEDLTGGKDIVLSTANYTLPVHVENLTLTGSGEINGTGNSADNVITGNDGKNTLTGDDGNDYLKGGSGVDSLVGGNGNDFLNGGLGDDALNGGAGNDYYFVDDTLDSVTEVSGEGTDTANSSRTSVGGYTLPDNVENLTLITGSTNIDGTGNTLNNVITGNDGNNSLSGDLGNDYLKGGLGADILDGGLGKDTLTGGSGQDVFKLMNSSSVDTIADFSVANDKIQLEDAVFAQLTTLGALDPTNFVKGTAASTIVQYVRYDDTTGDLYYDADGSNSGAAVKIAMIGADLDLTAANFAVI